MNYNKVIIERINAVKNTIECFTIDNVVNIEIHDTCDGAYFELKYYNLSYKDCRLIEPMRGIISIKMEEEWCILSVNIVIIG